MVGRPTKGELMANQYPRRVVMFNINLQRQIMDFKTEEQMLEISKNWKENPNDWKVKEVELKKIEIPEVITTSPFQCSDCDFIGKSDFSLNTHRRFKHKGRK